MPRKFKVKRKVSGKARDICTVLLTEFVDNLKVRFEDTTEIELSNKQSFDLLAQACADLSYQLSILFREGFLEPENCKEPRFLDDQLPNELGNSVSIAESNRQRNLQWSPSWQNFFVNLSSVFIHLSRFEAITPPRICNPWEYCAQTWEDRELLVFLQRTVKWTQQANQGLKRLLESERARGHKRQKIIDAKSKRIKELEALLGMVPTLRTTSTGEYKHPSTLEEFLQIENLRHKISSIVSEEKQLQSRHEIRIKSMLPKQIRHLTHDGYPADSVFDDSFSSVSSLTGYGTTLWDLDLKKYFTVLSIKRQEK